MSLLNAGHDAPVNSIAFSCFPARQQPTRGRSKAGPRAPPPSFIVTASDDRLAKVWSLYGVPGTDRDAIERLPATYWETEEADEEERERLASQRSSVASASFGSSKDEHSPLKSKHLGFPESPTQLSARSSATSEYSESERASVEDSGRNVSCKLVYILAGHKRAVTTVSTSPKGYVATGGADGAIGVWDIFAGTLVVSVGLDSKGVNLSVAGRDTKKIAVVPDSRDMIPTLHGDDYVPLGQVRALSFSPKGQYLITGSVDEQAVRLWEFSKSELAFLTPLSSALGTAMVNARDGGGSSQKGGGQVAIDPRLKEAMTQKRLNGGFGLLSHDMRRKMQRLRQLSHATAVRFAPDGRLAVSCTLEGELSVWEIPPSHTDEVTHCCVLDDDTKQSRLLARRGSIARAAKSTALKGASVAVTAARDLRMKVWDLRTGAELATFVGHDGPINQVITARGGFYKQRLWKREAEYRRKSQMETETERGIMSSRSSLQEHSMTQSDVAFMIQQQEFMDKEPEEIVCKSVAVSCSVDGTARIWNIDETSLSFGSQIGRIDLRTNITSVAISADSTRLFCGTETGVAYLFELNTFTRLRHFDGEQALLCPI